MKKYNRVHADIHLDAIESNMEAMKANLSPGTGIIGVVKADGYGHGAVPAALAIDPYVEGYAVAAAEEAVILREHGISKMILVLGVVHPDWYEEMVRRRVSLTVFRYSQAQKLSATAEALGLKAPIHLAVDTGMSRIGLTPDEASAAEAEKISALPGISLEGVFTHFARADEADKTSADLQLRKYLAFAGMLKGRGISIPISHCANSAAIIDMKRAGLDMVRAGISIYGLYPSDEVDREAVPLKPAMELKSYITYLKEVPPGTEISYGGTFKTGRTTKVATVPVGYGDGYPRNLSGRGEVLVRGRRAPILGRVCMDQMMVDVTDIPGAEEEDEVTLIGREGEEQIPVEELAQRGGGFHYEILCGIGKRVPRIYIRNGRIVGSKDYFGDIYAGFERKNTGQTK